MFYLNVCLYTICVPVAQEDLKRTFDPLEVEL